MKPRTQWVPLLGLGLLLVGCGGAAPVAGGPPAFDLADLDGAEVFGVGPDVTRETPAGVRFRFSGRPGPGVRTSLVYARSLVSAAAPLEVRLNGVLVARAAPSDAFRTAPEVLLPAALLRGDDEVAFVPTVAGPWQVGELRVVTETLPPCGSDGCETKARELFERGARLHADRAVAAGNLARAAELLREALRHVERVEPPPSLRGRISVLLAEASAELDERCRGLRFAAVGQVHLGRWAEVGTTARAMADRFPLPDHPCHRSARRLLERLGTIEEEP